MIEAEKEAEAARIVERLSRESAVDLESMEFYVRAAMMSAGSRVLERVLQEVGVGRLEEPLVCSRKHLPANMKSTGVRAKTIETILGGVRFERTRFVCPVCGAVRYRGDELLGVCATGFSPGLRRLMTRAGSRESFGEAAEDLHVYAGLSVGAKDVERVAEATGVRIDDWMREQSSLAFAADSPGQEKIPVFYISLDGTGAPMRREELSGVRGKAEDAVARTREVKLGCVFTQTTLDDQGNPIRDAQSTTYVGAIEASSDFGHRLRGEALRRGLRRAQKVAVLSDGAPYNASIAREHFPDAIHILDFYHASERLSDFVKENTSQPCKGAFHEKCKGLLVGGKIEQLLEQMREQLPRRGERRKQAIKRIEYFAQRTEQMRYGHFKSQGLFIGSGVVEAGCKTLIGKRLKGSGMFWSVRGANAIIAARCCSYSGRFEDFWEDTAS